MADFIHLHNHTHFSLLDAACTVGDLVNAAVEQKMHAVALTDHGVLYGVSEFYQKAVAAKIKPIIGMEAYMTFESTRFDRPKQIPDSTGKRKRHYSHLILLAKNETGYRNLLRLSTIGFAEGFYYRPRIDFETLQKYHEGLICTTACLGGIVSHFLVNNQYEKARETAVRYKELFGDDFYLELQDHGQEEDKAVLTGVPKLSQELDIKMIATNDCHYIKQEDAVPHNVLLMVGEKSDTLDYKNLRYRSDLLYFRSETEMKKLFGKFPGAIENTVEIEEKVQLHFDLNNSHYPVFPIPEDSEAKTLDDYFEMLTRKGFERKFPKPDEALTSRLDFEIQTIRSMGFSGYFLIVQDFIDAAQKMGVLVGPGRGSAAGSLAAFVLGITKVNPLDYGLLFERFLNPARQSMPDIDVDFDDKNRDSVIDYVREKYGRECVAQIITFNTLSAKAVLRDVGRVLGLPLSTVNRVTKFIPTVMGKVYTIEKALKEVPELKWLAETRDDQLLSWIKYGKFLEGFYRNSGKHAAGVVIAPDEITKFVPLASASGDKSELVTQFNMNEIEKWGLLKMDFLSLKTLTIIKDALNMIKDNHGIAIDFDTIPLDDPLTFQLFGNGQTTGIFQFESPPMREYLKQMKPNSIHDLAAMNALYRPGPMGNIKDFLDMRAGRKPVHYLHALLEPILKETYGVIVYQEQVIQIANRMGGMTLGEADLLRRAMGKKKVDVMKKQRDKFIQGAVAKGVPESAANEVFELIFKFADYGFNKSHAVAYSILAYQTAYLKAHYTAEYMAAHLNNEFQNQSKVSGLLEDCRKLRIPVLQPDINHPSVTFYVDRKRIRFGLTAIKNVGQGAVEEIVRAKKVLGRNFTSMFDFTAAVDTRIMNKRTLEGLILGGAFDAFTPARHALFEAAATALEYGVQTQRIIEDKTTSLFADSDDYGSLPEPALPNVPEWSEEEKLAKEREVTGFYISKHPLQKYALEARSFSTLELDDPESLEKARGKVRLCGVITDLTTKMDKEGKTMAFFTLNGLSGSCEALMFGSVYAKFSEHVKPEKPVLVIGNTESSGDAIKINIETLYPMEKTLEIFAKAVRISIDGEKHTPEDITKLKSILVKHKGGLRVFAYYDKPGYEPRVFQLPQQIKLTQTFLKDTCKLFGEESVTVSS